MAEPSLKPMTVADFLIWEEGQAFGSAFELVDGTPHMMAPEKVLHTQVKGAVFLAVGRALAKASLAKCRVFTEGITIPVQDHSAYKPDISVYCGDDLDDDAIVMTSPLIVIEVLSPPTRSFDRGAKLIGYFSLESLKHYLLVDPDTKTVEHHTRVDGELVMQSYDGGNLTFDPPGVEVAVEDLFKPRWT